MKKLIISLPTISEILRRSRKPSIKKSKIINPKKGGPYNRAKMKVMHRKNS